MNDIIKHYFATHIYYIILYIWECLIKSLILFAVKIIIKTENNNNLSISTFLSISKIVVDTWLHR